MKADVANALSISTAIGNMQTAFGGIIDAIRAIQIIVTTTAAPPPPVDPGTGPSPNKPTRELPISIDGGGIGYAEGGWPSGPDSGYLAMLHGKEVVLSRPKPVSDVNSSKSTDETNALLRTLIAAVQEGKVIAIDGKPIAQIADQNRINSERRPGNKMRRIV